MKFVLDRIKNGIETVKDPLVENKSSYGQIIVDKNLCDLCMVCMDNCIVSAINLVDKNIVIENKSCIFCKKCIDTCPKGAIKMTNDYKLSSLENLGDRVRERIYSKFKRSLNLRAVDIGSCNGCFLELSSTTNTYYDLSRYGVHISASPRHVDGLIVSGALSINMKEALIKTYESIAEPKIVIAIGACSYDGGIFKTGYSVNQSVCDIIPVDLYIPGCPPSPSAILEGIFKIIGD